MSGGFRLDGENVGSIVRWLAHDAIIFGGNSGGPLVNVNGQIVGINEIGLGSLGGAIPANLAKDVAQQIIEHGHVKRSWIGVEVQPRLRSGDANSGVLVGGVIDDSPAKKAGLEPGDVITSYDGQKVDCEIAEQMPIFNQLLLSTPVGKTVKVEYLRDDKPQDHRADHRRPRARPAQTARDQVVGNRRPGYLPHDGAGQPSARPGRRARRFASAGRALRHRQAVHPSRRHHPQDQRQARQGPRRAPQAVRRGHQGQRRPRGRARRLRPRHQQAADRREGRQGRARRQARARPQALAGRRHPGAHPRPRRVARPERQNRRPRDGGLPRPGRRKGRPRSRRHHPARSTAWTSRRPSPATPTSTRR